MLRDKEKNKDNRHYRVHTKTKVEVDKIQQEWRTIGRPNFAQSGNQGEGRDQEEDQAEDGKTT